MGSPLSEGAPLLLRAWWNVLAGFSPRKAQAARHFYRMDRDPTYRETALASLRARGYRHASSSAITTPWLNGGERLSADSHLLHQLPRLRERSRELGRDNAVACGILSTFEANVIGTGITCRSSTGDKTKDDAIDGVWARLKESLVPAESMNWRGLQALLLRRLLEDGEVFLKKAATGNEPLWFEVVEADRVLTPADAARYMSDPQGQIRDGIERDRHGRIVAYWIANRHPAEALTHVVVGTRPPQPVLSSTDFDRVPASEARHLALKERPGQSRGVPILHAVLQDLLDLDLLLLASLKRTQVAACLAVFLETSDTLQETTADKYGLLLDQKLVPGSIFRTLPGEKVQTVAPNFPLTDLDTFVWCLARRIGTAIGISPGTLLSDHSPANYSSARVDLVEESIGYETKRQQIVDGALRWMRTEALDDARLRGEPMLRGTATADYEACAFLAPKKPWVDPEKEAKAAEVELALGLTTRRDLCASKGRDWEEVLRQRLVEAQREAELRAELGLSPAEEPSAPVQLAEAA